MKTFDAVSKEDYQLPDGIDEEINKWINEKIKEWTNEWMNEWICSDCVL